eukprot:ctg_940.g412
MPQRRVVHQHHLAVATDVNIQFQKAASVCCFLQCPQRVLHVGATGAAVPDHPQQRAVGSPRLAVDWIRQSQRKGDARPVRKGEGASPLRVIERQRHRDAREEDEEAGRSSPRPPPSIGNRAPDRGVRRMVGASVLLGGMVGVVVGQTCAPLSLFTLPNSATRPTSPAHWCDGIGRPTDRPFCRERRPHGTSRIRVIHDFLHTDHALAFAPASPPTLSGHQLAVGTGHLRYVIRADVTKTPAAVPVEPQHLLVESPQARSVAHRQQRDAQLARALVQEALHVQTHRRGAFVEHRVLRSMEEQSRHSQPLLLAAAEHIGPVTHIVPAVAAFAQFTQMHLLQQLLQIIVAQAALAHVAGGQRVDDLLAQRAQRQVRPLRHVEHAVIGWTVQRAAVQRPQSAQHPEQRRLAAAVRPGDEHIGAGRCVDGQSLHQQRAVRRDDIHVLEADEIHIVHQTARRHQCPQLYVFLCRSSLARQ